MRERSEVAGVVSRLRDAAAAGLMESEQARVTQLRQLKRLLEENDERISAALAADLGKSPIESFTTETSFVIGEVEHALEHLGAWMQPIRVRVPLTLRPGNARVIRQPLGVVLIMAAWNYPLHLTLAPLVGALAAGNTAVLKPSEAAPATSAMIAELVPRYLDGRVVQVIEGGVEQTTAVLAERFDHILYTGGGAVAHIVMRAAAEHLTPVTLELGGKSPAIVAADADLDVAARRITWGRFTNAGQTCVAPDYVLVVRSVEDQLLGAVLRSVHDFYGENPQTSPDYGRIINDRHFDRLVGLLEAGGYEAVVTGGSSDRDTRYLAPTVLAGVDPAAAVMSEEIFGPILPVVPVESLDEAVAFVTARPHPLALYLFTEDGPTAERVIERTRSGGVAVNHTMIQLAVPDLPFGGIGASGIGAYHGEAGFDRFSHRRAVLTKATRPDPSVSYPPYKRWKEAILRRVL
ncbi:MAG TPA: aldehyde dehydrogenase family protein [Desertimonas sp.]|nr:aldehyde dehydrogenase family protein [Desertimonas sp.]